ncbi:pyridoxal phosphate-dependent transferase [Syncephalis plumigaleata]|nr:pyridoxal phosphate-dependent transferase [Syncephalis plumigaleata]
MISSNHPINDLEQVARETGTNLADAAFASVMDSRDPLQALRQEFVIPRTTDGREESIYLCGNSLGAMPKRAKQYVQEEFDVWGEKGVLGHTQHKFNRPWLTIDERATETTAELVGAKPLEVAIMGTLTENLHMLMVSFYRPTATRYKILLEKKAFPSDIYAINSQIRMHGYDPKSGMIMLEPRQGEYTLRNEDILSAIEEYGDELAHSILYGQLFDMESITRAGHAKGCYVGFDLAHAVGNVPLSLHEWNVDFASWCTYKYLNAGAGGIAAYRDPTIPRLSGWWSNNTETRFEMTEELRPAIGANVYRVSNTPALTTSSLIGSLEVFKLTSIEKLRAKSLLMTAYLEYLLGPLEKEYGITIITPRSPEERGCQLSILFPQNVSVLFDKLLQAGVICDERKPNCIRLAPVPLYNCFSDIYQAVVILKQALKSTMTNINAASLHE